MFDIPLADGIISKYWKDGGLPIDPIRIAAKMGILVTADASLEGSGHYEPTASREGGPLITLRNRAAQAAGCRFTLDARSRRKPSGFSAKRRGTAEPCPC